MEKIKNKNKPGVAQKSKNFESSGVYEDYLFSGNTVPPGNRWTSNRRSQ